MADKARLLGGVPVQEGHFLLRVDKDGLVATLVPMDPTGHPPVDAVHLQTELAAQGVVFGLLPEPEAQPDGALAVARGLAPRHGEAARLVLHARPGGSEQPEEEIDLSVAVDLRERHSLVNVSAGQALADKVPPTEGSPGRNVFGETMPPKPGKDIRLKGGPGVSVSDDGLHLTADIDGKYVLVDNKPAVLAEHLVRTDVDMSVGNVTFVGALLRILGWVLPGFTVRGKGEVRIMQGVEGARVEAGADLDIRGCVRGNEAHITTGGNLAVNIVEAGFVEAGGDLVVRDYCLGCRAKVGGNLLAKKGKGAILGGHYVVGGDLHALVVGEETEVTTEVFLGARPELLAAREKVEEELQVWPEKLNEVLKNITALERIKKQAGGRLPPEKERLRHKLGEIMPVLVRQVDGLKTRQKEIDAELAAANQARLYVYQTLYPGVTIHIGKAVRTTTAVDQRVVAEVHEETGEIHIRKMSDDEYDRGMLT
ncbi:MAG: FapA family protein [Thermodesulfobacteriota bacterium]